MINEYLNNIARFFFLILLQVLVLNNIQFLGFANPFLYVLFILLLPFETPGWIMILLSFLVGITVDIFSDTYGLHAAASVFMGFLRSVVLVLISPRDGYEPGSSPRVKSMGFIWFIKYTSLLIVAHHFFLFFVEAFNTSDIKSIILRALSSSVLTFVLVALSQFFARRK